MRGKTETTSQHADYFYFRTSTRIFSDHRDAEANLPKPDPDTCAACLADLDAAPRLDNGSTKQKSKRGGTSSRAIPSTDDSDAVECDLCDRRFHPACTPADLLNGEHDGEYHCERCCNSPFEVYTCWIPLGRLTHQMGVLAVCPGTHRISGYDRPLSGKPLVSRIGLLFPSFVLRFFFSIRG